MPQSAHVNSWCCIRPQVSQTRPVPKRAITCGRPELPRARFTFGRKIRLRVGVARGWGSRRVRRASRTSHPHRENRLPRTHEVLQRKTCSKR